MFGPSESFPVVYYFVRFVMQFLDGYIGTSIVRECLKADLLALLMKMSNESHVKSPYVTYLMVSFSFIPDE